MDAFSMGSIKSSAGWKVISDTGTTDILVTPDIFAEIAKIVPVKERGLIDCNATLPDLQLTISGKILTIPAKQLIRKVESICVFNIALDYNLGGDGPSWILGDPFIRSYCNVHELVDNKIGFAEVIA